MFLTVMLYIYKFIDSPFYGVFPFILPATRLPPYAQSIDRTYMVDQSQYQRRYLASKAGQVVLVD